MIKFINENLNHKNKLFVSDLIEFATDINLQPANQVGKWLGKDYQSVINKAGDNVFISRDGLRKIHFHMEIFSNGKWRDAIPGSHRFYPKP